MTILGRIVTGSLGPMSIRHVDRQCRLVTGTNAFNNKAVGPSTSGATVDLGGTGNLLTSPAGFGTTRTCDFAQPGSEFEINLLQACT